ncbi:helix-turn-helix transcriptional regulator [Microvirga terrestris]|uniref:HTH luxR-type domain-containing protein n=1 Tax=Microvirga terrestris TaxID=2791024 RepID=A0ABS0HTM9_9HYPH|nr:LuxR C-terminal-related transcriptional regulator [Microvirga terrestris]MBF9196621.1 hypothetical protein [Microvirga terrestris]
MNLNDAYNELLEIIYSLEPGSWDLFGRRTGALLHSAHGLYVSGLPPPQSKLFLSHSLDERYFSIYQDYYYKVSVLYPRLIGKVPPAQVVLDVNMVDKDELHRSEYYNDWAAPQDFHHACGVWIPIDENARIVAGYNRSSRLGRFTPEEVAFVQSLLPHVGRAARLTQKLELGKAAASAGRIALEHLEAAVFLVSRQGVVLETNAAALRLMRNQGTFRLHAGRLHLQLNQGQNFTDLVRKVLDSRTGTSFMIHQSDGTMVQAFLNPLSSNVLWSSSPGAVLVVQSRVADDLASLQRLRTAYKLTAAEERLLRALCEGESVADYCNRTGLSRNTVKTQMSSLFSKTNTSRQAELIRLALSQTMLRLRSAD